MTPSRFNSSRTQFHVRAVAAPDVMSRCLDLIAKRDMVPSYWHAEVAAGGALNFEFHLDGIDSQLESYLAECFRRIINVETVVTSRAAAQRQA